MDPLVSVIVPCHNYEKYIEQCILSILVQRTNFKVEILIGDDCSTDSSLSIVKRMKNWYESENLIFTIVEREKNVGEVENTRGLLERAHGKYIAYLDADDYWTDPAKLQKQFDHLQANPEISMCITGHINLEGETYIPSPDFYNWLCPMNQDTSKSSLLEGNNIGASSSRFFRNYPDLFQDYFYEFPYSDWPLNFELLLRGRIDYMNFPSYVYRRHPQGLSATAQSHIPMEIQIDLYHKRCSILRDILNSRSLG
jgi:glycosyltransferase involved in cell wall biosynthesis